MNRILATVEHYFHNSYIPESDKNIYQLQLAFADGKILSLVDVQNIILNTATDGNDTITSSYYSGNTIYGGAGNDTITALYGDNYLYGGDGDDIITGSGTLIGGAGNDKLIGGVGNDALYGGDGDDIIYAGLGDDYVKLGRGTTILLMSLVREVAVMIPIYSVWDTGRIF